MSNEFTNEELFDLRLACSKAISFWRDRAYAEGEKDPETCHRLAGRYHQLWEKCYDTTAKRKGEPLWSELHPQTKEAEECLTLPKQSAAR